MVENVEIQNHENLLIIIILLCYRDKLSWTSCLKSLLVLHNETINIWSHLLGFLFFVALFWRDILFLIPAKESGVEVSDSDFFVLCSLIICYQVSQNDFDIQLQSFRS